MDEALAANNLAEQYLEIRDAIEALEAQKKALEEKKDAIAAKMSEICEQTGADSIRTDKGTIIRSIRTTYFTSDWDSLHHTVLQYQAPYLLEKRIHNSAMKEFLEAYPDAYPAGMNVKNQYTIMVRRPSKKV